MMEERVDCVVIGAGVIGLACARALALAGRDVVVIEANEGIGMETSSRNSEVIHAGIYYPAGSYKARFCVSGKLALYRYCDEHGVETRRCGKLIVATREAEVELLAVLRGKAEANGVHDLELLDSAAAQRLEPAVHCLAALNSPTTGIVDTHGLMLAYQGDAEAAGAFFAFRSPLVGGAIRDDGIALDVGGADPLRLVAAAVVNCAGHGAAAVARSLSGLDTTTVPPCYIAKGNYFTLTGILPFRRLVYPVPGSDGLGIHSCIDLAGRPRFGPDHEWVEDMNYDVDPRRAEAFYESIRRYWPDLPDNSLQPDYAGIRPKLQPPGGAAQDFLFRGPKDHGVPGLVSLFGFESPGLTSSLSIAGHVLELLG